MKLIRFRYCNMENAFSILFLLSVCADFCINFIKRKVLYFILFCFFVSHFEDIVCLFKSLFFGIYSHTERNSSLFNGFFKKNPERSRQVKSELFENACRLVLQIFVYSNLYQCACHNAPPKTIKKCVCNLNICECNVFVNKTKRMGV